MADRFPFPANPTGWYRVGLIGGFTAHELSRLHYFGQELIGYRGADGRPRVADAFCPHLGAHLGHGGCLDGEQLVCPFHGWRFDADGHNVEIPYAERVNRRAALQMYEARDWCGMVMAWYSADGAPPAWELPALPELDDEGFTVYIPEGVSWQIHSHPQEIFENIVDAAHFKFIHQTPSFGNLSVTSDGHSMRAEAEIELTTPRGPVAGAAVNEVFGLGVNVNRIVGVGRACAITLATPVEGDLVEVSYSFICPKGKDGEPISNFGKGFVKESIVQLEADFPIWEHKMHRVVPSLARGEGPVLDFRRWATQFYGASPERELVPTAREAAGASN